MSALHFDPPSLYCRSCGSSLAHRVETQGRERMVHGRCDCGVLTARIIPRLSDSAPYSHSRRDAAGGAADSYPAPFPPFSIPLRCGPLSPDLPRAASLVSDPQPHGSRGLAATLRSLGRDGNLVPSQRALDHK